MCSKGYGSRFVCVCVCVFVCPIEILRMAALSIELSHVLCIKSNYLQNACAVCRKTLSFPKVAATSASGCMATPIIISVVFT